MTISRVYNKSGFSHRRFLERATLRNKICHRYTFAEKLKVLEAAYNMRMENHLSLTDSANILQVDPSMICRWAKMKDIDDAKVQSKFQLHPGLRVSLVTSNRT